MQFGSRPVALVHGPWRHPTRGSTRECQVAASPDLPRVRMVSCDWERGAVVGWIDFTLVAPFVLWNLPFRLHQELNTEYST